MQKGFSSLASPPLSLCSILADGGDDGSDRIPRPRAARQVAALTHCQRLATRRTMTLPVWYLPSRSSTMSRDSSFA